MESPKERVVMCCSNCKYWTRLSISDQWLPEDAEGECEGLTIKNVDIELKTGWDGGYVERIETKHDFFCANFDT